MKVYLAEQKEDAELQFQILEYLCSKLVERIQAGGGCPMPFIEKSGFLANLNPDHVLLGQTITPEETMRFSMDTMQDGSGKLWLPLFTDEKERGKGQTGANVIMWFPIADLIREGLRREDVEGIVVNPFGESITLSKPVLQAVLAAC